MGHRTGINDGYRVTSAAKFQRGRQPEDSCTGDNDGLLCGHIAVHPHPRFRGVRL